MSPSSRRAWIEIVRYVCQWSGSGVALLAEGVDRNFAHRVYHKHTSVALLAEGVDRNHTPRVRVKSGPASPSSRRAWIEIHIYV